MLHKVKHTRMVGCGDGGGGRGAASTPIAKHKLQDQVLHQMAIRYAAHSVFFWSSLTNIDVFST